MEVPMYIVDAFTTGKAFTGNPAAVCLLDKAIPDEECLKIAAQMNLSETAFILKLNPEDSFDQSSVFGLRWWTPESEVVLCGHATLAAAHVLFHSTANTNSTITFRSRFSGDLAITKTPNGLLQLDFPLRTIQNLDLENNLVAKKMAEVSCGTIPISEALFSDPTGFKNLILVLNISREAMESLVVDTEQLLKADPCGNEIRLLTLTASDEGDHRFCSRVFAPFYGVAEDPVTGSAHSPLGRYWSGVLGSAVLGARQCSGRGGDLELEVVGERIHIAGTTRLVLNGSFHLPHTLHS